MAAENTPKDLEARYARASDAIDRAKRDLHEAHNLLSGIAGEVTNARARGAINQKIWDCERFAGHRNIFFSQAGQDAFLDEKVFRGKRNGTFVEIGGFDGITGSNCLFFELMRGWNGVIIEPSPTYHAKCAAFRKSPCLQVAVGDTRRNAEFLEITGGMRQMSGLVHSYNADLRERVEADPRHQGEVIKVEVRSLAQILDAHDLRQIDYISLDVEGAEMSVLRDFPFEAYQITAFTIENNDANREVPALMAANGYKRVEAIGVDDVYVLDPRESDGR
ncbi:MAG: FkbM family methyltransferase [Pseudomonadota bacterium]